MTAGTGEGWSTWHHLYIIIVAGECERVHLTCTSCVCSDGC